MLREQESVLLRGLTSSPKVDGAGDILFTGMAMLHVNCWSLSHLAWPSMGLLLTCGPGVLALW